MNTKGRSASPSAIAASGFAKPPSSVSSATIVSQPARIDQHAGANRSVASVMARHFRCGDNGAMPRGREFRRDATTEVTVPGPRGSAFDGPGGQAAHEVALQPEEHGQR